MTKRPKKEIDVLRGRAIKAARLRKGLVTRQVADLVGVQTGAVGNWESGQNAIASAHFFKLCEVLEIDAAALEKGGLVYLNGDETEANLVSALLAYGVDGDEIVNALKAIRGFVSDDDERSKEDPPRGQSESANPRHVRAP